MGDREMDLSGNICSTCCTVFPRAVLSPIDKEEEEELVTLVLGAFKSKSKLLTCHLCRTQLSTFAHFVKVARGNIAKLRQVHEEQQVALRQEDLRQGERERKSPDTTWSLDTSILNRENVGSPRLEISVRDSPSPPITWSRDNTVTIVALEDSRAKEAEKIRGYISCVAVQGEEPVERIDVTPDLSIHGGGGGGGGGKASLSTSLPSCPHPCAQLRPTPILLPVFQLPPPPSTI